MAPSSLQPPLPAGFVGVLDSGAGGLSVLGALMAELPGQDFAYFGDGAHNPYGEKDPSWVLQRVRSIAQGFVDAGAGAIVIACNTATAVAAAPLRREFPAVPIIGVEPALKPAAQAPGVERILVMATPMTLHQDKFHHLAEAWGTACEVRTVECPGLALFIEQGGADGPGAVSFVEDLVGAYRGQVDAVVLGCTHYPFIADAIREVLGPVQLFDGAAGTARQLRRRLQEAGRLPQAPAGGRVSLHCSDERPEVLQRYRSLLQRVL